MAIGEVDGFKFLDGQPDKQIVVESERISEYVEYIKKKEIKQVYICDLFYYNHAIDFLAEIPFIEGLNINCNMYVNDYTGLYSLDNLKVLLMDEPRAAVHLERMPAIEDLRLTVNKNVTGIDKLEELKRLRIHKYKPKSGDLEEISMLDQIESLEIIQSNIKTLSGCGKFRHLRKLDLAYLSRLQSIGDLVKNKDTLQYLEIESCRKIEDYECLGEMTGLEELRFLSCGDIESIGFIENLPRLRDFVFMKTNVLDGNLYPCERLDYVAFTNKKHYTHKLKDFRK